MSVLRDFWAHFWATYKGRCYYHHGEPWPQGEGVTAGPRWVVWLDRLVTRPAFAFEQAYICNVMLRWNDERGEFDDTLWPYWPAKLATDLHHWLYFAVIKPNTRNYRWNRPDSGFPNEVGFHSYVDEYRESRFDGVDCREMLEAMRDDPSGPSDRSPTRIYVQCSGDGETAITYTGSGGDTYSVTWDAEFGGESWSYT